MEDSWRRFGVLFVGFTLLFASILGFVVAVEHDYHCGLSEVRDSPQGASIEYYYSELSDGRQQVFDRLQQQPDQTVHSDVCFDGIVRYQNQYYVVNEWRSIQWLSLPTLLTTGGIVGAVGIIISVIRREMKDAPS